jgi:hypothetical protein
VERFCKIINEWDWFKERIGNELIVGILRDDDA